MEAVIYMYKAERIACSKANPPIIAKTIRQTKRADKPAFHSCCKAFSKCSSRSAPSISPSDLVTVETSHPGILLISRKPRSCPSIIRTSHDLNDVELGLATGRGGRALSRTPGLRAAGSLLTDLGNRPA